jgi:DNA-directed RNA polymerase specialized sigma24 family protein
MNRKDGKPKKNPPKRKVAKTVKKKPVIAKTLKFEECIDIIDTEIIKRKNKWSLTALAWMDFDDVSQILRIHIFKKWHLYDQTKKLTPWINRIISNQIKNLIRNNYGNYVRPCVKCAAAEGEDLCAIYKKQSVSCPLFKNWYKNKKSAYDTKLPIALENHSQEVFSVQNQNSIDMDAASEKLHNKMGNILKANEWLVYKYLYIDHLTEEQAAKKMGYKTTEKNRSPGYKQIKNLKKSIITKVKKVISNDEVDIF